MNAMLSLDGKTVITETSIKDAHLHYSVLEFIKRYKEAHGRMIEEEIDFSEKMSNELYNILKNIEDEDWAF